MATRRTVKALGPALLLALGFSAWHSTARAQVPAPRVPDTTKRSGLFTRHVPIQPYLPPDKKRDNWYDTRWGDPPNERSHPNFYKNGGLYGLPWRAAYTRSIYPYFYGSPGRDTIPPDYEPAAGMMNRIGRGLFHPFTPVGMYYDQGSYVPIYNLDPLVPGPGGWLLRRPHIINPTHGGG